MNFTTYKHVLRRSLWIALFSLPLTACSSLGSLGGEHFTLEGELPPDFSLKAQAHYAPVNPSCLTDRQARSFKTEFQKGSQQYRFRIPVSYRAGLCEVELARVGLFVYGRFGEKDWQQTYDNGGIALVDKLPQGAPAFDHDGRLIRRAECSWLFKLSTADSRLGQIDKLLSCKGAGALVMHSDLFGKTIQLNIHVNSEEEPAIDRRWVKTVGGWKPCQETAQSDRCQSPPVFKEFQMNGRTCTVYPHCTE